MKLGVITTLGVPIQSDEFRDEIVGRVLLKLRPVVTRGGAETAIRAAFKELEDELRAQTINLSPAHR